MIPAPTRYVTIEGTTVMVAPASANEAKAAIKELRHKKKELTWLRRTLVRQRKAAEARKDRASRAKTRKRGLAARLRAALDVITAVPRLFSRTAANVDIGKLEREIQGIDETMHNIDSAMIQVQGKLLHMT